MKLENIVALEVHWFETFGGKHMVIPTYMEGLILQNHLKDFGTLPKWNVAF
jgi:hypothetical protein